MPDTTPLQRVTHFLIRGYDFVWLYLRRTISLLCVLKYVLFIRGRFYSYFVKYHQTEILIHYKTPLSIKFVLSV